MVFNKSAFKLECKHFWSVGKLTKSSCILLSVSSMTIVGTSELVLSSLVAVISPDEIEISSSIAGTSVTDDEDNGIVPITIGAITLITEYGNQLASTENLKQAHLSIADNHFK